MLRSRTWASSRLCSWCSSEHTVLYRKACSIPSRNSLGTLCALCFNAPTGTCLAKSILTFLTVCSCTSFFLYEQYSNQGRFTLSPRPPSWRSMKNPTLVYEYILYIIKPFKLWSNFHITRIYCAMLRLYEFLLCIHMYG